MTSERAEWTVSEELWKTTQACTCSCGNRLRVFSSPMGSSARSSSAHSSDYSLTRACVFVSKRKHVLGAAINRSTMKAINWSKQRFENKAARFFPIVGSRREEFCP